MRCGGCGGKLGSTATEVPGLRGTRLANPPPIVNPGDNKVSYTADGYIREIYEKLQVNTRSGVVAKALKEGLV